MRYAAGIALIAVLALAFGTTGAAWAHGCGGGSKHHGNPAVAQYVEKIPTACGSKGTRGGAAGSGTSSSLPTSVSQQLGRSAQGKLLRSVSSSTRYGAPNAPRRTDAQNRGTSQNALSASISAVSSGSNSGLIALLLVMAFVALGVAGLAVYRRRAPR